ncbi:hypothetical protein J6590_015698 [Homalodisca vitripennis]|nr:hypothetical protein J6590_015698 [Homalodisca vitripennis]
MRFEDNNMSGGWGGTNYETARWHLIARYSHGQRGTEYRWDELIGRSVSSKSHDRPVEVKSIVTSSENRDRDAEWPRDRRPSVVLVTAISVKCFPHDRSYFPNL